MENGYGREVRRNSYGQPVHEHYPQRWNTNQYQNSYQRGSQNQQFYQPSNHNNPHNYHQVPYVPPTNQNPNFFYDHWQEQQ